MKVAGLSSLLQAEFVFFVYLCSKNSDADILFRWIKLQKDIAATNIIGFSANVRFIDEKQYSGLTGEELLQRIPSLNELAAFL